MFPLDGLSTLLHNFHPSEFFWPLNVRSWHSFRNAKWHHGPCILVINLSITQMLHTLLKIVTRIEIRHVSNCQCHGLISWTLGFHVFVEKTAEDLCTSTQHSSTVAGCHAGSILSVPEHEHLACKSWPCIWEDFKHFSHVFQTWWKK